MALLALGVALITLQAGAPPAAERSRAHQEAAAGLMERAVALRGLGSLDAALAEIDKAVSLSPKEPGSHVLRGFILYDKLDEHSALAALERAIQLGTRDARAYNSAAWILSTSKDHSLRDARRALALAVEACRMSAWQDPSFIDTLAAAHADAGNFDEAVRWQERALEFPQMQRIDGPGARARLELYRAGRPYRAAPNQ